MPHKSISHNSSPLLCGQLYSVSHEETLGSTGFVNVEDKDCNKRDDGLEEKPEETHSLKVHVICSHSYTRKKIITTEWRREIEHNCI